MRNGFRVIDADAHSQDALAQWVEYMGARVLGPATPHRVRGGERRAGADLLPAAPVRALPGAGEAHRQSAGRGGATGGTAVIREFMPKKYPNGYPVNWTPESRLMDMDLYGWDKQVMVTGFGILGWHHLENRDQGLLWACSRAWHNWLHDYCSADLKRLYFVGTMPRQHDIEGLLAETRRIVEDLGSVTVDMPRATRGQSWHEPFYDPFWSLAQDLDIPISFHGVHSGDPRWGHATSPATSCRGSRWPWTTRCTTPSRTCCRWAISSTWACWSASPSCGSPCWRATRGGCRGGSAAWTTMRWSPAARGMWFDAPLLPMAPSDYFRRQGFAACDGDEGALPAVVHLGWEDNVVWNTDYPHSDAPDPRVAVDSLLGQDIPEEAKGKILWDNSVRLYGPRIL